MNVLKAWNHILINVVKHATILFFKDSNNLQELQFWLKLKISIKNIATNFWVENFNRIIFSFLQFSIPYTTTKHFVNSLL